MRTVGMRCDGGGGAEEGAARAENGYCPRQHQDDNTAAWPQTRVEREHTLAAGVANPPGGGDGGGHPLLNYHRRGGLQQEEKQRGRTEDAKEEGKKDGRSNGRCEEVKVEEKKNERSEEVNKYISRMGQQGGRW